MEIGESRFSWAIKLDFWRRSALIFLGHPRPSAKESEASSQDLRHSKDAMDLIHKKWSAPFSPGDWQVRAHL